MIFRRNPFYDILIQKGWLYEKMSPITKEFALQLLEKNETPNHVVQHCMAVANASVLLATELNKCGYNLSIEVIEGAAMIHDIARVYEDHELLGAEIAEKHGFHQEAVIIRKHMHYAITTDIECITEIDIVCLGDRMIKENQYVGLKKRMDYILEKWHGNEKAEAIIRGKVREQSALLLEIEKIIGISMDELIDEKGFTND